MPDRQRMQALTLPLAQLPEVEGREEDTHECVFRSKTQQHWPGKAWQIVKRYPIPCGAIVLMIVSLVLWLTGYGSFANWTLLVVVLLGGFRCCGKRYNSSCTRNLGST